MWWKTIFRPRPKPQAEEPVFDEGFLRRLEQLALVASKTLRGGLVGDHRSRRRLPAPTVADHRPYTHGDDLRYVDWNAFGRHDTLHIKMGEAEQDIQVTIMLDQSASMDYGSGSSHKWHFARQLAAAIGYCALAQGDRVALHGIAAAPQPLFAGRSRQRGAQLLNALATARLGGRGSLADALGALVRLTGTTSRRGVVVIISDLWHAGDLRQALKRLQGPQWQVVVLHLLHGAELKPGLAGDVELVDSETGATEHINLDGEARDRYRARLERWCANLEQLLAQYGAQYAFLRTDESLERAVLPYLRTRQVFK